MSVPNLTGFLIHDYFFEGGQSYDIVNVDNEQEESKEEAVIPVPIYRGQHICSEKFVREFRYHFSKSFSQEELASNELGPLFGNFTMPECNIVSHTVSRLRLLEFHEQLVHP